MFDHHTGYFCPGQVAQSVRTSSQYTKAVDLEEKEMEIGMEVGIPAKGDYFGSPDI